MIKSQNVNSGFFCLYQIFHLPLRKNKKQP